MPRLLTLVVSHLDGRSGLGPIDMLVELSRDGSKLEALVESEGPRTREFLAGTDTERGTLLACGQTTVGHDTVLTTEIELATLRVRGAAVRD